MSSHLGINSLKDGINFNLKQKIWFEMMKPDLRTGKLAIIHRLKSKFMFPFGDIAPLDEFEPDYSK